MMYPTMYNVVWDTPGEDHHASMPLGNGEIGLNAWVEPDGDLVFYIARTDSWGDNARLLKIGRIRISLEPNRYNADMPFKHTLDLAHGTMRVAFGEGEAATHLALWVDANHPVVNVTVESTTDVTVMAQIELWRIVPETLLGLEESDVYLDRSKPGHQHAPTIVEPDTIISQLPDQIGWYHFNQKSVGPALTAQLQGLTGFQREDPLLHRIFGGIIFTEHGQKRDDTRLQSPASQTHHIGVVIVTQHPSAPQAWMDAVTETIKVYQQTALDAHYEAHQAWWRAFWQRSWINISGDADGDTISQRYALQRYINACAGRGAFPIKFNGSLFTVPYEGAPGNADYRRWGGGYWWQNTRLPYISMCASGDFDLLQPLFKMYAEDLLPLFRYRTQHYFGHAGIYVPECVYFWGDVFSATYGWTPFEEREDKLQEGGHHKWEWVSGLELGYFMLDYYDHTLDTPFLQESATFHI